MNVIYFDKRIDCPVCYSRVSHVLYQCPYGEEPVRGYLQRAEYYRPDFNLLTTATYRLRRCHNCHLVYQEEIPNRRLQAIIYERWLNADYITQKHLKVDDLGYYKYYAFDIMFILNLLGRLPSEVDILDYGFGLGRWARMARAFGCNVYGMEISPSRRKIAKDMGIDIIGPNSTKNFDVINLDQVLEHVPRPVELLQNLRGCLKKGGFFKLAVPDGSNIEVNLSRGMWAAPRHSRFSLVAAYPLEHINCFNGRSFNYMIEAAGLKRKEIPMMAKISYAAHNLVFTPKVNKATYYRLRNFWRYLDGDTMALAQ